MKPTHPEVINPDLLGSIEAWYSITARWSSRDILWRRCSSSDRKRTMPVQVRGTPS